MATGAVNATIANNGTGALIFTAAAFNAPVAMTGGAARTLVLGGSFGTTATPNEIQGVIADNTLNGAAANTNIVSLSKGGAGTWRISGVNTYTYTGTTTISAGILILGANNVLPSTTNVIIGAATLDADTRTDTMGTLDPSAAATIRLSTGAALAFADSSAVVWAGGTLAITGSFVSGSSLRFGASATALTATQLAQITRAGVTSFTLDSNGYLIANTAPTFTSWQTTNGSAGAFTADHDSDSVAYGIEYFLGGNSNTTGQTPLLGVTNTSGTLSVTWTESATYPGTWTTETVGGNVTVNGNNITYTFPTSTRRFVRLKVVGP